MTYTIRRTITLTYDSEERYREDRTHWYLPATGEGQFGPFKHWRHEIEEDVDDHD